MPRASSLSFAAALAMAFAMTPASVHAQAAPGVPTAAQRAQAPRPKAWTLGIGFAPVFAPAWQGSRDQALSIFPDVRINYRDAVFFSVPDGLGWNMINQDGWKIGPLFKFRFRRNESNGGSPFLISGGSIALQGMGNVGFAGEPGGFAQYGWAKNRAKLRAEVRQGFGGHSGVVADTSIAWGDRIGTPGTNGLWLYSVGARATFASSDYTNAYFGVTPIQAANTGLPAFRTADGIVSTGLSTSLTKPIGRMGQGGAVTLFGGYDRLGDAAADSSLIVQRGKRDQFSVGLSYGVRFSWG